MHADREQAITKPILSSANLRRWTGHMPRPQSFDHPAARNGISFAEQTGTKTLAVENTNGVGSRPYVHSLPCHKNGGDGKTQVGHKEPSRPKISGACERQVTDQEPAVRTGWHSARSSAIADAQVVLEAACRERLLPPAPNKSNRPLAATEQLIPCLSGYDACATHLERQRENRGSRSSVTNSGWLAESFPA
jgi:hypothetical protein